MSGDRRAGAAERTRLLLQHVMFAGRWLLAPIYLGMIVALALLMVKFLQELIESIPKLLVMSTSEVIVELLSLVDLSLCANLLLMVMLAGYENFVSSFASEVVDDRPRWLSQTDYGALKLKLLSSIIAIASVKMLEVYLDVGNQPREDLVMHVVMFITFGVVAVLLALMDRLATESKPH